MSLLVMYTGAVALASTLCALVHSSSLIYLLRGCIILFHASIGILCKPPPVPLPDRSSIHLSSTLSFAPSFQDAATNEALNFAPPF